MNKNIEVPKEKVVDIGYKLILGFTGELPLGGVINEVLTSVIPISIEKRTQRWREEVTSILNDLNNRYGNIVDELRNNDEFVTLLLEATNYALRTHRIEKIKLFGQILRNSLNTTGNFYIKEMYVKYIDELDPKQIEILNFVRKNKTQLNKIDTYQKLYQLLVARGMFISVKVEDQFDLSVLKYFLKDLESKGLIVVSEYFEDTKNNVKDYTSVVTDDENQNGLPYISITGLADDFLMLIMNNSYL